MVLNRQVGKVMIFNTETNKFLKEVVISTASTNAYGQFLHVRWAKNKTIMAGLSAEKKVAEFDFGGKEIWSV